MDVRHLFARCATRLCHLIRKAPFGLAALADDDVRIDFSTVTTPKDRVAVVDMPEQEWDRVMRINLKGVFLCAQAAAKHMISRKEGRILSIASGRGVAGAPRSAHYAASKAGVIAFTKSLAVELAADNITVNCVCPGATDTPMSRIGYTSEQFQKREEIPPLMDGLTHKFEIVGLVRYLLSDATKFVTGQTFFLRTPK